VKVGELNENREKSRVKVVICGWEKKTRNPFEHLKKKTGDVLRGAKTPLDLALPSVESRLPSSLTRNQAGLSKVTFSVIGKSLLNSRESDAKDEVGKRKARVGRTSPSEKPHVFLAGEGKWAPSVNHLGEARLVREVS